MQTNASALCQREQQLLFPPSGGSCVQTQGHHVPALLEGSLELLAYLEVLVVAADEQTGHMMLTPAAERRSRFYRHADPHERIRVADGDSKIEM